MKPRLLDLFCGAGGCSVGYARAGFEVVGIDIRPQPHYPFEFIRANALNALRGWWDGNNYDAIHASPPCKPFTVARKVSESKRSTLFDPHEDLLTPTRALLSSLGIPYIIENVPGAPMHPKSVMLCGSAFGLRVRPHRLFESNMPLRSNGCHHASQPEVVGVYGNGGAWTRTAPGGGGRKVVGAEAAAALGIDWTDDQPELAQAIPPAYTEFVGLQLLESLVSR